MLFNNLKKQKGITLWGVAIAGFFLIVGSMLAMKVLPAVTEFYKVKKNIHATVNKEGPNATKKDLMRTYDKFADVDYLEIDSSKLRFKKVGGQWEITADYEKRIPLFWNVYLVLDYYTSTGNGPRVARSARSDRGILD